MRKIIIDTDTATDDAIAIIMALKNRNFDDKAKTTNAGNVAVSYTHLTQPPNREV